MRTNTSMLTLCAVALSCSVVACGGDEGEVQKAVSSAQTAGTEGEASGLSGATSVGASDDGEFKGVAPREANSCEERCIQSTCTEEKIEGCVDVGFCLGDCDAQAENISNHELEVCNARCLENVTVQQLAGLAKSGLCMANRCLAEDACEAAAEASGQDVSEVCEAAEEAAHQAAQEVCEACVTGICTAPGAEEIYECKQECGLGQLACRIECNGDAGDREVAQAIGAVIACAIPCAL